MVGFSHKILHRQELSGEFFAIFQPKRYRMNLELEHTAFFVFISSSELHLINIQRSNTYNTQATMQSFWFWFGLVRVVI
jgi:hypothetical protein